MNTLRRLTHSKLPLRGAALRSAALRLRTPTALVAVIGVVLLTIGGRLLGFLREVLISSQYGTSAVADSFFTVQQIPTIVSVFLVGPLLIVYVPHYAAMREAGQERAALDRTFRTATRAGALITAAMLVGGVSAVLLSVGPMADGRPLIGTYTIVLALSILPLIVTGLATVVLHARGRHLGAMTIAALAPGVMAASLLLFTRLPIISPVDALPWSFTIGAAVAGIVGSAALRSVRRAARDDGAAPSTTALPIGRFSRELAASVAENIGFSINQALTVLIAASIGGGAVATNAYALRMAAFAFSATISPLNQVVQTWMTVHPSRREGPKLFAALLAVAVLAIMIAAALTFAAPALVEIVYVRGSFASADAARVAALIRPYAIYLGVTALNQLMARYFFVQGTGARYAAVMLAAYTVGNILKPLGASVAGLDGIIWASVIAEGAALVYFAAYAIRRGRRHQVAE